MTNIPAGCRISASIFSGTGSRSLSPGLAGQSQRSAAAYEIKFLVDAAIAHEIIAHMDGFLSPDPHGASAPSETKAVGEVACPTTIDRRDVRGAYRITTIYTDTQGWDVYCRNGRLAHVKYRARTDGDGGWTYLERKIKRGDRVSKTRAAVAAEELSKMNLATPLPRGVGEWFRRSLRRYALAPVCTISYVRQAFIGATDEGPFRVTFDRDIRGSIRTGWDGGSPPDVRLFAQDEVICEFKFCGAMPSLFKYAIARWKLNARGVSKYRRGVETLLLNSWVGRNQTCPNG